MLGFFVNLYKLLRAVRHGIRLDEEFRVLLVVLLTLLGGATYFYWSVEGWSVIDALYFSVMTMSTIGYGDFTPTTTFSKIFTIIFAVLSIGVFVAVVSKIVTIILAEKKASKARKQNKSSQA
jgi:voltage-gated potassium channel